MIYKAVIVDFRNTSPTDAQTAIDMVHEAELEHIDWYRMPEQRLGMAVARCALRHALGHIGVMADIPITVAKDTDGKPVHPACHISLSHCDGFAAAAAGSWGPVGIDVELRREVSLDDFRSVLNAEEWSFIHDHAQLHHFFDLWTRKEAILKCMGTGYLLSPESIGVLTNPAVTATELPYYWHRLDSFPEIAASAACIQADAVWEIESLTLNELLASEG